MTYDERKQAQRCTRPGCASPPADGHSLCAPHRDEHRRRNRRWGRLRRFTHAINVALLIALLIPA